MFCLNDITSISNFLSGSTHELHFACCWDVSRQKNSQTPRANGTKYRYKCPTAILVLEQFTVPVFSIKTMGTSSFFDGYVKMWALSVER